MSPRSASERPHLISLPWLAGLAVLLTVCLVPPAAHAQTCTDNLNNSGFPQPLDRVEVTGDPLYPGPIVPQGKPAATGGGLCGAFRLSPNPAADFQPHPSDVRTRPNLFPDSVNAFLERNPTSDRIDRTLATPFDLSNGIDVAPSALGGDFVNTPGCSGRGCAFPGSEGMVLDGAFGTRFRGFLYVKPEWVLKSLHFAFFANDSVGMRIFWKDPASPPAPARPKLQSAWVMSRGPTLGSLDYVVTNAVKFNKPGLYPVEIVHAQLAAGAALEFSVLFDVPSFQDRDQPVSLQGRIPLSSASCPFELQYTNPVNFFQAQCGGFAYGGTEGACQQCPETWRDRPRDPATGGTPPYYPCAPGYYCNAATVCSPCVEDHQCGAECQPCTGKTKRCQVDPAKPCELPKVKCVECTDDSDCASDQRCTRDNRCVAPPCCPGFFEVRPDANKPSFRLCSPCLTAEHCISKGLGDFCDVRNARCVKGAPTCSSDDEHCGATCNVNCKALNDGRPYCLNGQSCAECRRDTDCQEKTPGTFCLSGRCSPCTNDRHCGLNCRSCGTDLVLEEGSSEPKAIPTSTPYCAAPDNAASSASCVQCRDERDCGEGRLCKAGKCTPDVTCDKTCINGEVCFGGNCVQCVTNSQCPCGTCIDGRCTDQCQNNMDCQGNQCCQKTTGLCVTGKCGGSSGGALCGCAVAPSTPALDLIDPPLSDETVSHSRSVALAVVSLLFFGLALRRRLRWS